jgi:transcriptional regulator with XRE-family HTH domain
MSSLAQRLRYYRKQNGMTQEKTAAALGIRSVNYAKYEAGERNPREDKLIALSKLFGVSYIGLSEGAERTFCDLLHAHIQGAVLNDTEGFGAFTYDVLKDSEAFPFVKTCFDKWRGVCRDRWGDWYSKYVETPAFPKLVFLGEKLAAYEYSEAGSSNISTQNRDATVAKLVFCIAVTDYLTATDPGNIICEAADMLGDCTAIAPLQYFAVKVFVPYLSFIANAVELTENTFISDFENAFLYGTLTLPDCGNEILTNAEEPDNE